MHPDGYSFPWQNCTRVSQGPVIQKQTPCLSKAPGEIRSWTSFSELYVPGCFWIVTDKESWTKTGKRKEESTRNLSDSTPEKYKIRAPIPTGNDFFCYEQSWRRQDRKTTNLLLCRDGSPKVKISYLPNFLRSDRQSCLCLPSSNIPRGWSFHSSSSPVGEEEAEIWIEWNISVSSSCLQIPKHFLSRQWLWHVKV